MRIARETLYGKLKLVSPGLSPREFIEQSSCFVFKDGQVVTFNDEIACRIESGLSITGAVQSNLLLEILEKLPDDELDVLDDGDGELRFKGKGRNFSVTRDASIFLPVDRVENPEKWRSLPDGFLQAIGLVGHCVSGDESKFVLTCVNLEAEWVEACDNYQAMRCAISTGLKRSVLVRGASIAHIVGLGMSEISLTKNWVHFRNEAGLVFSCRRFREDYPDLAPLLDVEKGHPITLPKGLSDATERAAIFAKDNSGDTVVKVILDGKRHKLRISGQGVTGTYNETKRTTYDGPRIEFLISPGLLRHVSDNYSDAEISETKLKVVGGSWSYATVLGAKSAEEPEEEGGEE